MIERLRYYFLLEFATFSRRFFTVKFRKFQLKFFMNVLNMLSDSFCTNKKYISNLLMAVSING